VGGKLESEGPLGYCFDKVNDDPYMSAESFEKGESKLQKEALLHLFNKTGLTEQDIDIIFGGGGQDSNQDKIEDDLRKIGPKLKKLVEADVPTLVVCGLYQLFGDYFETAEGKIIHGIDILDIATKAGPTRLIGNVIISTPEFGEIVGYENHSGLTSLGKNVTAFGTVVKGYGNNSEDFTEGAKYKNCIGTYLHGPILPKNPRLADYFIKKALEKRGNTNKLERLNDSIEHRAHKVASSRPQ
jgi:CobQ-like glutamine amidotransferase family enzyme